MAASAPIAVSVSAVLEILRVGTHARATLCIGGGVGIVTTLERIRVVSRR